MKTIITKFKSVQNWALPLLLTVILFNPTGLKAFTSPADEKIERPKGKFESLGEDGVNVFPGERRFSSLKPPFLLSIEDMKKGDVISVSNEYLFESNRTAWAGDHIPKITKQPQNLTVYEGDNFSLTVGAECDVPISYQWWCNGMLVKGGNYHTINISNASDFDQGLYWVEVSSDYGKVTSRTAEVRVQFKPYIKIIKQPTDIKACKGTTDQNLEVTANCNSVEPLHYQWYKNGVKIPGGYYPILNLPPITMEVAGSYKCRAYNPYTYMEVFSDAVQVYMYDKPEIFSQDTLVIAKSGQSATLNVNALPVDPVDTSFHTVFHWYKRKAGAEDEKLLDGELYSGVNSRNLTIKSADNSSYLFNKDGYYLEVEGKCGKTISKLIHVAPSLGVIFNSEEPGNIDGCPWWEYTDAAHSSMSWRYTVDLKPLANDHFDSVRFEHITSARDLWYDKYGVENVKTFSWEEFKKFDKNSKYSLVSKAFKSIPTHLQDQTHKLRATFFPSGEVFESPGVAWTFHDVQEITKQPQSITVEEGTEILLSLEAKCDLPLTYQWRRDGEIIADYTNPTFYVLKPTLGDAGSYWCEVRSQCDTIYSDTAEVIVKTKGIISPNDRYNSNGSISLNPNPASEVLEITFNAVRLHSATFRILELSGREVMSFTAEPGEKFIRRDISSIAPGTYFILMESGGETRFEKFTVVK